MTATEDENLQTIRDLEEKISELKETAQRDRHTKNQDDERIKHLEEALQKAQTDLQTVQAAAAIVPQGSNPSGNQTTFTLIMNVYDNDLFISRSDDKKLYLKATTHENKVLYDLSAKHFDTFLESVREKIGDYALNRNHNFEVPITKDGTTSYMPLINHYEECTMTEVFDHAKSIWFSGTSTTINENQDTLRRHMAYLIIRNMLTQEARKAMNQKSTTFMFSTFGDEPCLFKAIVIKVKPSTKTSVKAMKLELRNLDLKQFSYHVPNENATFDKIYKEIIRQGGVHEDMTLDLFTFWYTSINKQFKVYVQRIEDDINDGSQSYTYEEMVTRVETKYTNLIADKKWTIEDPKEKEIMALKTVLQEILNDKKASRSKGNKKRSYKGEWIVKPDEGQTTKTINGRECKWCEKCNDDNGAWTTSHTTDEHGKKKPSTSNNDESSDNKLEMSDELKSALATLNLNNKKAGNF